VNGPGNRFALWVQGCSRNCAGCFNPLTHNAQSGWEMSVETIVKNISADIKGITISGGEPFEQAEELEKLLEFTSKLNLHSLVYTGYCYEELKAMKNKSVNHSLSLIHILIDGEYNQYIKPNHPLSGSGNQRILELKKGKIIREITCAEEICQNGELHIDHCGNITTTGFMDLEIMKR
jgi:anaerobic ribonucleoside-triphosphate reductase activating protein